MAWAGSTAAIVQAVSRLGFGWLYDQVGFKKIFLALMTLNFMNALFCFHARNSEWAFFISIQLCYLVNSGVFSTFPLPILQTFGSKFGPRVYAFIMFSNGFSAILNLILSSLNESGIVPIEFIFYSLAVSSLMAFLICWNFDERIEPKEMEKLVRNGDIQV